MKVLHIVATGRLSGAEKVVYDICSNLDKDKYEVLIICAGDELKNYYEERGLRSAVIDISRLNPMEILKLRSLLKKEKFDLIHAHDVKASIAAAVASEKLSIPVISHIHGNYTWLESNPVMKCIDKHFRKKYNLSIACSDNVAEYYKKYNKDSFPMKVMLNAFNFSEFSKTHIVDNKIMREKLNIDAQDYVIGYMGRIIKLKGVDLLINAFRSVAHKYDKVKLLIVGEGEERQYCEKLVSGLSLQDKVIFAGYQKDKYDYLNIFDCFIMQSEIEGIPIVLLEAMAMKKPVITTPVGGIPEVVRDDFNGLYINKRDSETISALLEKLMDHEEMSRSLAENAYEYLLKNLNVKDYILKLEKIYSYYMV